MKKFRAWDTSDGETYTMKYSSDYSSLLLFFTYVSDEFLMEWTGLKDKNGKEIYEGDILDKAYHNLSTFDKVTGPVEMTDLTDSDGYNHGSCWAWGCGGNSLSDLSDGGGEVIGNIYEHEHLIKEITNETR